MKLNEPDFYDEDLWNNRIIFIESYEFSNYLYGEQEVVDSFINDGFMYLTIKSEFNQFVNDSYIPTIFPKILINDYIRIKDVEAITEEDKEYTNLSIDLKVPASITGLKSRLRFIQSYYLLDNHNILIDGLYQSYIQIENYLQVFLTSINKSEKILTASISEEIQNI